MNDRERRRDVLANAIGYAWVKELEPERVQDDVLIITAEEARAARAAAKRAEAHMAVYGLGYPTEPPECNTPRLIAAIDQALHKADQVIRANERDAIRAPSPTRAIARSRQQVAKLVTKPLKLAFADVDDTGPVRPTREDLTAGIRTVLEYLDDVIETGGPPRPLAFKIARMLLRVQSGQEPM